MVLGVTIKADRFMSNSALTSAIGGDKTGCLVLGVPMKADKIVSSSALTSVMGWGKTGGLIQGVLTKANNGCERETVDTAPIRKGY